MPINIWMDKDVRYMYMYVCMCVCMCVYIYIYIMKYYSAIKKEWNSAIWDALDEPRGYYAKLSKSEKDKHCMISLIYGIWKTKQMNKQQNRNRVIDTENKQVVARGEGVEDWEK